MKNYYVTKNNHEFDNWFDFPYMPKHPHNFMRTDIVENENDYVVLIDVPSVKRENIQISLEEGNLLVSINEPANNEETKVNYLCHERYYGTYERSFYVGKNISEDNIQASLEDGTLKLIIKKVTDKIPNKKIIAIN